MGRLPKKQKRAYTINLILYTVALVALLGTGFILHAKLPAEALMTNAQHLNAFLVTLFLTVIISMFLTLIFAEHDTFRAHVKHA